ncbi:complex I NDUFA9 subunit family protein [Maritimibacter dapengensis]|uniref:Complex I NDUFA9 subunit family protein n=1 Tax=Maritimibacter dapengensis TaxID=2836868 RepID=A0ABS6T364_9RHOB|nr:complex I NDUFA9 subunit family protein [Maritimibacter dapengensis]MBV7379690.1 complex I NDUFA9 subunit family protein [Maritimibacter dapengensis]
MSKLVTIYGGSGFVGRYIARRMAKAGWRVRIAVRRPNEALFVKPYGTVGQVAPILCNIRDDASVASAMKGADAVVNCVGTFDKGGKNNFDAVQHVGAERVARLAKAEGVSNLVHISAVGADADGPSLYAKSKAQGEAAILAHFPDAVILRPSVMFGPGDGFFNRFAGMTRFGPVLPIVGADTRFQPVYVDDVAHAAEMGAKGEAAPGIYELGGPDVSTFREWMEEMLDVVQRRRLIVNIPFWIARIMGWGFDVANAITGRLFAMPISQDQVAQLGVDNVVSDDAKSFADLGITPTATEIILPEYLWRFRKDGQYADITASARNLRT